MFIICTHCVDYLLRPPVAVDAIQGDGAVGTREGEAGPQGDQSKQFHVN